MSHHISFDQIVKKNSCLVKDGEKYDIEKIKEHKNIT
jgi:hypothetical protein